jgi:glutamine---fructose-6-phosphate transaminase (isomerizing)
MLSSSCFPILLPIDCRFVKILANMEEVTSQVIVIPDSPAAFKDRTDEVIMVPATYPVLLPFVSAVPLQFLAYHVAVMCSCDMNQPRNLAEGVIVE